MDVSKIMRKYYSDNSWSCGVTYESLVWGDETMPKPTKEELDTKYSELLIDEMREECDRLLKESDYTALPDFPNRDLFLEYKQKLRDFPSIWTLGMEFPQPPT